MKISQKGDRQFLIYLTIVLVVLLRIDLFAHIFSNVLGYITPLLVGIVLAFLLNRPMLFFEQILQKMASGKKRPMHRAIAITISYLCLIMIVVLIVSFVVPELANSVNTFTDNIDVYLNNLQQFFNRFGDVININGMIDLDQIISQGVTFFTDTIKNFLPKIFAATTGLLSGLITFFLSIVVSIYLLISKEKILYYLGVVAKVNISTTMYQKIEDTTKIVIETFNKYVIGQLLEATILGTLCFIGMQIFRFDYALLISVCIGITALIPILGAYIGAGVAFVLLFLVSPVKALWFIVYLVILQQVENNFIYPHVVGTSLGLPPLVVLLAITIGGGMFGLTGMIFAVPVAAIIYALAKSAIDDKWDAYLGKKGIKE